jgi:hypothetical protein
MTLNNHKLVRRMLKARQGGNNGTNGGNGNVGGGSAAASSATASESRAAASECSLFVVTPVAQYT